MQVIVPAAGLSSRFPGTKPKYLLYSYDHRMMIRDAVEPFIGQYNITVGILKQHNELYNAEVFLRNEIPNVNLVILDEPTSGPAETVFRIIEKAQLDHTNSVFIKDCDSFFNFEMDAITTKENFICTSRISDHSKLHNLSAKSFVRINEHGFVLDIAEKNVISDTFCVGGYKFESIKTFCAAFRSLGHHSRENPKELFVSDVIEYMLESGYIFHNTPVTEYFDVGTLEAWNEYNDVPVIFCDIDGTLIEAQGRYGPNNYYDTPKPIEGNYKELLRLQEKGVMIIFTTSREKKYMEVTKEMLHSLGFEDFTLLCGLFASKRILINDYNEANPYPRALAINIRRNSDTLKDLL